MPPTSRLLGVAGLALFLSLTACPKGQCFLRFQETDSAGNVKSNKCLLDTCPTNASFTDGTGCACQANFVTLGGGCVTLAEATASCGVGNKYENGGCIAITCPAGQILNAQTGACQSKQASDQAVAANAGVTLKEGQAVGCPAGYTYVVNGADGACVPNELTCATGTKWDGSKCVAVQCPAGNAYDAATGQCVKLATTGDEKTFSVQAKLKAAMGPDFCAPHAKNPAGFNVQPGQTLTIKVLVSVTVPNQQLDQTALVSARTTNLGGAELTEKMYPGVARINKQVNEQVLTGIRSLGGKSVEPNATAEVSCVIKRAPIQVVETHGGGV